MTRIVVSGCNGKMGHEIVSIISETPDCQVAAGIDIHITGNEGFPAFVNAEEFSGEADVLIDFSHPSALSSLLELGKKRRLPLVLCTTGYSKAQVEELKAASKEIPIFYSRNMSLGINLLIELSKKAAQVLGKGFDIEIIEKHHNQKIDAPTGTALMLADEISTVLPEEPKYVYDRHSRRMKRKPKNV